MKKSQLQGLGLGAAIGGGSALVFYFLFWISFGTLLAGSQSILIPLLSILYPAGCGALLLGFYVDGPAQFQKMILHTLLTSLGFVLGVFLWRYAMHLLTVLLGGGFLLELVVAAAFLTLPIIHALKLLLRRP